MKLILTVSDKSDNQGPIHLLAAYCQWEYICSIRRLATRRATFAEFSGGAQYARVQPRRDEFQAPNAVQDCNAKIGFHRTCLLFHRSNHLGQREVGVQEDRHAGSGGQF